MLGAEMVCLVKDGESKTGKHARRIRARTNGLNHGDGHIVFGSHIAAFSLYASDANAWQKGPQFSRPLVHEEFLVDNDEESAFQGGGNGDGSERLPVPTWQTENAAIPRRPKGGDGGDLVIAGLALKDEIGAEGIAIRQRLGIRWSVCLCSPTPRQIPAGGVFQIHAEGREFAGVGGGCFGRHGQRLFHRLCLCGGEGGFENRVSLAREDPVGSGCGGCWCCRCHGVIRPTQPLPPIIFSHGTKQRMHPSEAVVAVVLAALATAIATGKLPVPPAIAESSIAHALLLILALVLYSYSPVVGIVGIVLFAVILFGRNMQKATQYTRMATGPREAPRVTQPYGTQNAAAKPTHAVAAMNEDENPLNAIGQYPMQEERPYAVPFNTDFLYRPAEDTGSDTFERYGPNMDEKMSAFAY